ncbi:site-specific integrase [Paraburkholderia sp. BR10872]|uniref:site-specific integrase n=1 Tax=Paraburkholderia sp. BR10872 TaxID=3236989 RepID=UPI0034D26D76
MPEDAWPEPSSVVEYLRRNTANWKWATFRQYQASLACFYEHEAAERGEAEFGRIAEAIRRLPWQDCKPENAVGQTSSRKRKGIPENDFSVLVGNLANPRNGGRWSQVAAAWLLAALPTGLRPVEWKQATLQVDLESGQGTLEVVNAKATNGRANGKSRTIDLKPEDVIVVHAHLEAVRALTNQGYAFETIHECCAAELRRACRRVWGKESAKRFSLYSARHQFSANIKAQESHERVAELLGHGSVRTARRHYAPRRSAWLKWRDQKDKPAAKPNAPGTTRGG